MDVQAAGVNFSPTKGTSSTSNSQSADPQHWWYFLHFNSVWILNLQNQIKLSKQSNSLFHLHNYYGSIHPPDLSNQTESKLREQIQRIPIDPG
jgi:hypothetical protein